MKHNGVKKHITKVASYTAVGSIGLALMGALTGCEHRQEAETIPPQQNQQQGYFIVIQETGPDAYKIVEQYPTPGTTRAILKKLDGSEQLLGEEELKKLSASEAQKVEQGTSRLTQPENGTMSGGMSLGETILASAAGAIIGSWLGSKLFNNPNYQQRTAKAPSTYSAPKKPTAPAAANQAPQRKTGYMQSAPRKSSFGFGG